MRNANFCRERVKVRNISIILISVYIFCGLLWIFSGHILPFGFVESGIVFNCILFLMISSSILYLMIYFRWIAAKQNEETLIDIAEGVTSQSGEAFFQSLVKYLSKSLKVDHAFIGTFADSSKAAIKTIAVSQNGKEMAIGQFSIDNTPGQKVIEEKYFCCPKGLQKAFPLDLGLSVLNMDSYMALALIDSEGQSLGIIGILHSKPLGNIRMAKSLLKIFAIRVSAELERMRTEEALKNSNDRFQLAASVVSSVIYEYEANTGRVVWTKGLEEVFGYAINEEVSTSDWWKDKFHPEDRLRVLEQFSDDMKAGGHYFYEYRFRHYNGQYLSVWDQGSVMLDEQGEPYRIVGSITDISESKLAEEQIKRMAYYDPITHLPNRDLFYDRLNQELTQASYAGDKFAVMFMDLDRFKLINDTFGHSRGDSVLQAVANRLVSSLREDVTISRLSGDEFVILMPKISNIQDATKEVKKILSKLSEEPIMDGHELYVTTSIGISMYPEDGENLEALIKNAEIAMYRSKELGKNNYQFYTAAMNARAYETIALEFNLRKAVERREILVHYQPQVDLSSGNIVGLEALMRWNHPELGLVSPAEFIPLAEETGLIVPIGEWVMYDACMQIKNWQDMGYTPIPVSINLSANQFKQKNLVETVQRVLDETGVDGRFVHFEITESILVQNVDETINTLKQLKAMGSKISIDDFGTGYSSLSYLKRFPVDTLKVDQYFVREMTTVTEDAAIVKTVIELAHNLKLKVVAEGVETEGQLKLLKEYRCDRMQGYYFSRPMPADSIEEFFVKSQHFTVG